MDREGNSKTPLQKEFAPPDSFATASRGRDHDGGSDYPLFSLINESQGQRTSLGLGGRWRGV
jgi:hypothetical protein